MPKIERPDELEMQVHYTEYEVIIFLLFMLLAHF